MIDWGAHLQQQILPWWESRAIDEQSGGVFTCFDNAGTLLSQEKYSWSQGRWAWLCAELAVEAADGGIEADADRWATRARDTARFLDAHVVLDDGRTVFRTDREGAGLPDPEGRLSTSVFADLFVALGLSAASRMTSDRTEAERWQGRARTILITAERAIEARKAPSEPYPVPDGFTALAWPMNLLHTAAELLRADPGDPVVRDVRDRSWLALLGEGGMLATDTWWEFRPDADPAGRAVEEETVLARHRTPGHLLELVWMLDHAAHPRGVADHDRHGHPPVPTRVDPDQMVRLSREALRIGVDREQGGLLRHVDQQGGAPTGGTPAAGADRYEHLVRSTWDTKLWWVHSEALYTLDLLTDHDPGLRDELDRLTAYTLDTFPDLEHGEWIQIRRRDGSPLDEVVALPVKDPFHVARSLLLLHRHQRSRPERSRP